MTDWDVAQAIVAIIITMVPALLVAYPKPIIVTMVPALAIVFRKRLAILAWTLFAGIAVLVLVILVVYGMWLSRLPSPAILAVAVGYVAVAVGHVLLMKMLRWGWVALLVVAAFPRVPRTRRAVLAVVAACWLPTGAYLAYRRIWYLPPELGPPSGYRIVRRTYYPELSLWVRPPTFRHLEMHSADTGSPKAAVLDRIEQRLLSAGWKRLRRAEGRTAVLDAIPDWSSVHRDVTSRELAYFLGFRPRCSAATVFADAGVSVMFFTRGDTEYQDVSFLVYDQADGRTIECHLAAGVDW